MKYLDKAAVISDCGKYRYALFRKWKESAPTVAFIGLNPSTADGETDDATIRRCVSFADSWGFGALCMLNLFAFRATDPKDMKNASDPVGPLNDSMLNHFAKLSEVRVAMWGSHGSYIGRAAAIGTKLGTLQCFKINADGSPAHPLYLPKSTELKPYEATQ